MSDNKAYVIVMVVILLSGFLYFLADRIFPEQPKYCQGYYIDLPEEFNQRDSSDTFIIVRQTKDTIVLGFKN